MVNTQKQKISYERTSCEGCKLEGIASHCLELTPLMEGYKCWIPPDNKGLKFDGGKLRWSEAPWKAFQKIVDVMQYGAEKYEVDNWKGVDPKRYADAMIRHFAAWITGEDKDRESSLHHLSHIGCNAAFLIELIVGNDKEGENNGNRFK